MADLYPFTTFLSIDPLWIIPFVLGILAALDWKMR